SPDTRAAGIGRRRRPADSFLIRSRRLLFPGSFRGGIIRSVNSRQHPWRNGAGAAGRAVSSPTSRGPGRVRAPPVEGAGGAGRGRAHTRRRGSVPPRTPLRRAAMAAKSTSAPRERTGSGHDAGEEPRLRVLIGSDTYPPDVNGAAYFTERLARGLAARDHDVHVVCASTGGRPGVRRAGGV